jgi:CBS-domain-containing membrane protein
MERVKHLWGRRTGLERPRRREEGAHRRCNRRKERSMIGILIAVLLAALVYIILAALTGSTIVAIVGAVLVLLAGIPSSGFGMGGRWGGRADVR